MPGGIFASVAPTERRANRPRQHGPRPAAIYLGGKFVPRLGRFARPRPFANLQTVAPLRIASKAREFWFSLGTPHANRGKAGWASRAPARMADLIQRGLKPFGFDGERRIGRTGHYERLSAWRRISTGQGRKTTNTSKRLPRRLALTRPEERIRLDEIESAVWALASRGLSSIAVCRVGKRGSP